MELDSARTLLFHTNMQYLWYGTYINIPFLFDFI